MSIYPVRCKTWWICRKQFDKEENRMIKFERDLIKDAIKRERLICSYCGKPLKDYNTCYVSHAFAHGYDDTNYCNKTCYEKQRLKYKSLNSLQRTVEYDKDLQNLLLHLVNTRIMGAKK